MIYDHYEGTTRSPNFGGSRISFALACTNCSKHLQGDENFCPNCGRKLVPRPRTFSLETLVEILNGIPADSISQRVSPFSAEDNTTPPPTSDTLNPTNAHTDDPKTSRTYDTFPPSHNMPIHPTLQ